MLKKASLFFHFLEITMDQSKRCSTSPRCYVALERVSRSVFKRYARVKLRARMQINGASRGLSTARRVRPIGRNFLDEPIARRALKNRQ